MAYQATHSATEGRRRAAVIGESLLGCLAPVNDDTFRSLLAALGDVPVTLDSRHCSPADRNQAVGR
jgi:hypothetical protein